MSDRLLTAREDENLARIQDEIAEWLTGVVYFAQVPSKPSRIKIGYTMNLRQRMRKLGCVPIVTVAGGPDLERFLHDYFGDVRVDGEWFALTGQLVAFLVAVKEKGIGEQVRWLA